MQILVAGASGYVGSRLVPRLLSAGHEVRALTRRASSLDRQPWLNRIQVAVGDVLDRTALGAAVKACDAAYYLVHQMDAGSSFSDLDRAGAANFAEVSAAARLRRIVYLGGLGPHHDQLSPHLKSRHEVGQELAAGPVPVTELRAGMIIGSGSLSFEMLRHLTEVLPIMTTPRWVRTRCQPIAIGDVLDLLVAVVADMSADSRIVEIGGPKALTYQEMMLTYARIAGLRRLIIPLPLLTPRLSSMWVGLVTPLPARVARPLVETLRYEMPFVVRSALPRDCRHRPTPMPPRHPATLPGAGARPTSTDGLSPPRPQPTMSSGHSAESVERSAITASTGPGACEDSSTGFLADEDYVEAAATRNSFAPETPSTSGESTTSPQTAPSAYVVR